MTALNDLAERVERAGADDANLIREAATALLGSVPDRMNRMLAAEAYESAAMMLVPEEARVILNIAEDQITVAIVAGTQSCGATPALALVAASLRARSAEL
ncbi:MAG TPA: hypothetical protein PKD48_02120 [Sphingopyxis sp.]|nr:hypothetical protein [Sphingopyxis sp.]